MRFFKAGLATVGTALFAAFLTFSASAGDGNDQGQNNNDQGGRRTFGTPGPIMGAGPVGLGVAGAALYRAFRRRRKQVKG
jgi:hypothetical protein